jgi:hypothetical protein
MQDVVQKLRDKGLVMGRMISYSKSTYRAAHPNNVVCFNGNIFTGEGKAWWGDIDVTVSDAALQEVANETGKTLYVLREMDGRFENENCDVERVKHAAVKTYVPAATDMYDVIEKAIRKKNNRKK